MWLKETFLSSELGWQRRSAVSQLVEASLPIKWKLESHICLLLAGHFTQKYYPHVQTAIWRASGTITRNGKGSLQTAQSIGSSFLERIC